jgi:hypothetical protein
MIDYRLIRQSMRPLLLAVSGIPAARAWENRAFIPPDPPVRWIRETLLPVVERLISEHWIEATGITQYSLFEPARNGTEAVDDLAKAIRTAFKPTTAVPAASLIVDRAECGTGLQEPDWYHVPIRITWRAYAPNT